MELSKEAKDNEGRVKRCTDEEVPLDNPKNNKKKEVVKQTVTCKAYEESDELSRLPITISKSRSSQKLLICGILDTGTST